MHDDEDDFGHWVLSPLLCVAVLYDIKFKCLVAVVGWLVAAQPSFADDREKVISIWKLVSLLRRDQPDHSAPRVWLFPPPSPRRRHKPSGIGVPERVHFTEF